MSNSHHAELGRHDSGKPLSSLDLKIFIKDVHDKNGRKRPLTVRPWATVKDVKDLLCKHLHVPPSSQCIYFGPLLTSARELPNHRTLQDAGIYRSGETLLLEIKGSGSLADPRSISSLRSKANDVCVSSSLIDLTPKSLQRLVQQARRGLALGLKPSLAPDGSGGSYFLCDARKIRVGVFKPADEEPFADNNPRGYVPQGDGNSLRQGIRPGELCLREVAAFILDHEGFSGVPMTTLAEAKHPALHINGSNWSLLEGGAAVGIHSLNSPASNGGDLMKKVGSFQEYVHSECSMDDLSPSKISIDEVHKIAILDIRLMNADRNVANILCQRIPEDPDHFRLIPIDHGYSLRSVCDVAWFDWCWLDWPQTKKPLSKKSRDYVLNLDIEADARLLQERLNMQNDVLDYFRASCNVLKAGVIAGLTLFDIASEILCRTDACGEIPSKLETLTTMASELAMSAVYNGRFHHATASIALEEQLSTVDLRRFDRPVQLPAPLGKPRPVMRSISSSLCSAVPSVGGESAFTDELFDSQASQTRPPPMVQSSASDYGSDADYSTSSAAEECEADEWAAAIVAVADESLDHDKFSRNRSISESSSSTDSSAKLSSSPVGFWYVRPGSTTIDDTSDDDEPICWTPSLSSSNAPGRFQNDIGPPHILPPSGFSSSNLSKLLNESEADFDIAEFSGSDNFDGLVPVSPAGELGSLPFRPAGSNKLVRSMSYTAFSTYHKDTKPQYSKSSAIRTDLSSTQEYDIFRTYFMKFIDLLIVRETERLNHKRNS